MNYGMEGPEYDADLQSYVRHRREGLRVGIFLDSGDGAATRVQVSVSLEAGGRTVTAGGCGERLFEAGRSPDGGLRVRAMFPVGAS